MLCVEVLVVTWRPFFKCHRRCYFFQNIVYLQWMWTMNVFVDFACHLEVNYCRFFLPPVRMRRNLPSLLQKLRIVCPYRYVIRMWSETKKFWVKVDPEHTWELVIRLVWTMTGSAAFRWRCRKIVHHFVMFHGYRSARGRIATRSVQPARHGAYHEGRGLALFPGVRSGGGYVSLGMPLGIGRIDLSCETS